MKAHEYWVEIGQSYGQYWRKLVWHVVGLSGWNESLCGKAIDISTLKFGTPTCKHCLRKLDKICKEQYSKEVENV